MNAVDDPEDWADHLNQLVMALPDEDARQLPHELGFIIGLELPPKAALRRYTKLGLPEDLLDRAGDKPSTLLELISFALESRSSSTSSGRY